MAGSLFAAASGAATNKIEIGTKENESIREKTREKQSDAIEKSKKSKNGLDTVRGPGYNINCRFLYAPDLHAAHRS